MPATLRLLTALCLLTATFACSDNDPPVPAEPDPNQPTAIRYLALGDSYTIGTAVTEGERWPVQLATALANPTTDRTAYRTVPDFIATNGWTTGELISAISRQQSLRTNYDLVSLLIGVNNQFRGLPLGQYRTEFEELLQTAISLADGEAERVFVVSIPDYSYTPFGRGNRQISAELDTFNAAAKEIAENYGVPFLNITPISREAEANPALVANDDLHPSGLQYQRWVEEVILAEVLRIL